jgi:uncharacterized protein
MDTAHLIRDARARRGLSQRELARRAGTSQAMIARYERGRVKPSLETLERLISSCGERLDVSSSPTTGGRLLDLVRSRRRDVAAVAARYHVRRVRVFGSAARGEDDDQSDLDLLVDLDPDHVTTLTDLAALRRELSDLLGVEVDVAAERLLRDGPRREAIAEAVAL